MGRDEISSALDKEFKPKEPVPTLVESGFEGLKGDLRTGGAKIADVMNWPEWSKSMADQAAKNYETAARRPTMSLADAKDWTDYPKILYEGAVQSLPSMAPVIAGSGAGALVGGPLGALAGGAIGGFGQFLGANIKQQQDDHKLSISETKLLPAAISAIAQAGLDSAGTIIPFAKIATPLVKIVGAKTAEKVIVRAATKAVEGGLVEGFTEGAQQAIQILQSDPSKLWEFGPEVQNDIGTAAFVGLGLGGVTGAGAGAIRKPAAPGAPPVDPNPPDPLRLGYNIRMPGTTEWDPTPAPPTPPAPQSPLGLPPPNTITPTGNDMPFPRPLQGTTGWGPGGGTGPTSSSLERMKSSLGQSGLDDIQKDLALNEKELAEIAKHFVQYNGETPLKAFSRAFEAYQQDGDPEGFEAHINKKQEEVRGPDAPGRKTGYIGPTELEQAARHSATSTAQLEAMYNDVGQAELEKLAKTFYLNIDSLNGLARHYSRGSEETPQQALKRAWDSWVNTGQEDVPVSPPPARPAPQQPTAPSAAAAPASSALPKAPDWLLQNNATALATATRLGLVDKVRDMAQRGLTAKQISQALPALSVDDVRAVRSSLGIDAAGPTVMPGGAIIPPEGQSNPKYEAPKPPEFPKTAAVNQMLKSFDGPKKDFDLSTLNRFIQDNNLTPMQVNTIAKKYDRSTWPNPEHSPLLPFITAHREWKEGIGSAKSVPKSKAPGQQVYDAAVQLVSGKVPPSQVVPNAKMARASFEELGRRMGTDAMQEWKNAGIEKIYGAKDRLDPGWFKGFLPSRNRGPIQAAGTDGTLSPNLRGAAQWKNDGIYNKIRIALGSAASPSTLQHEMMHIRLELMRQNAKVNAEEAYDLKQLLDYVGKSHPNELTRDDHEKIARGFQHFLEYGEAPTKGLKAVFEKFKKWLLDFFHQAQDYDVPMTKAAMEVYARLLGGDVGRPTKTSAAQTSKQVNRSGVPHALGHMPEGLASRAIDETGKVVGEHTDGMVADDIGTGVKESLFSRLKSKANTIFNKVSDPLGNLPNKRDYMVERMLTQGKADEINKLAKEMIEPLEKGNQTQLEQVYSYLTTRGASAGLITDDKARKAAMAIKTKINQIGRDLVAAGKMTTGSAAEFNDRYLPRLYLKYLIEKKGMKASGIKVSNEDYLRQRQDLSEEERKALGEVKDPRYLAATAMTRPVRDLAVHDFLRKVAANPEWTWQESLVNWNGKMVTPYYLRDEASDIRERAAKYGQNDKEKTELNAIAEKMEAAAAQNNPRDENYDPKLFSRLPMSKSYGDLRGAVVRKEIADDIGGMQSFSDPNNFMERWLGDRSSKLVKLNSLWKESKVVWNPPTQVRNFVSNLVLLHLSGVPLHRTVSLLPRAAKEISSDGQYWKIAKKYGIASSTMTENELRQNTDKFLKSLEGLNHGRVKGSLAPVMKAANFLRENAGKAYQHAEYLGKVLKIIDAMEREGKTESQAALEANDALFDYSLVSPSIRYLRNAPLGMPFVTFTSKVLPFLIKNAQTPRGAMKMAGYAALAHTIPYLVAQMNDIDHDDVETLRKSLSEQLRKRGDLYLLPFKDENGHWQFADLGYFFPWQQVMDFGRAVGNANPTDAARAVGILSSPTVAVVSALTTGIDSFTGQPIMDKRDPPYEQAVSLVKYAMGLVLPPVFTQYGAVGRALDSQTGTGLNRYGEPGLTGGQLVSRSMGLNVTPVLPDAQRQRNVMAMQNDINAEKTRMNQQLRDQSISPEKRQSLIKSYQDDLRYRYEKLVKYIAETQPSAKLSAANARP